jgi:hypothetical protein
MFKEFLLSPVYLGDTIVKTMMLEEQGEEVKDVLGAQEYLAAGPRDTLQHD